MSLAILQQISDKTDEIYELLITGGLSNRVSARLDKLESACFAGGPGLVVSSASIANVLRSSNYVSGTSGWQILRTGAVEFDQATIRGAIYASSGHISGILYVGTPSDRIIIDGSAKLIKSENYVTGLTGWKVDYIGDAEFRNATIRGELKASVITYGEVMTTAGSSLVVKSAGALKNAVTTVASPTTFNVDVKDPDTGHTQLFAVGDKLRMKNGTLDNWLTVSSVSDQTTFYRYVCTLNSGTPGTFYPGTAVADYGTATDGGILLTADDTNGPFLRIFTTGATPWTSVTERVRIGNLNGWGSFVTDVYGMAVGDSSGGNYFLYDPVTNHSAASFGSGVLLANQNGICIIPASSYSKERAFKFSTADAATVYSEWQCVNGASALTTTFKNYSQASKSSTIAILGYSPSGQASTVNVKAIYNNVDTATIELASTNAGAGSVKIKSGSAYAIEIDNDQVSTFGTIAHTVTVKTSGGDFTTIQAAINWAKTCPQIKVSVSVDAGSWSELLTVSDLPLGITIVGDTRILAGLTYIDGEPGNRAALTNGGDGTVSLSNAGANITVTPTGANPDFDADGWGNGDTVIIRDNAGATTAYTVLNAANNVIALTVAAPAVGNNGTSITLCPNRWLTYNAAGTLVTTTSKLALSGFSLLPNATTDVALTAVNCPITLTRYLAFDANVGINLTYGAYLSGSGGAVSLVECGSGLVGTVGAIGNASYLVVSTATNYGVLATQGAVIHATYALVSGASMGFRALYNSQLRIDNAGAIVCTTGIYAGYNSHILAPTVAAFMVGNTADYSPAASDTEGNVYGIITRS